MPGMDPLSGPVGRPPAVPRNGPGRPAKPDPPVVLADFQLSDVEGSELGHEGGHERVNEMIDAGVVRSTGSVAGGVAILGQAQTSSCAAGSSRRDEPVLVVPVNQRVGSSRSRSRSASPRMGGATTGGAAVSV